MLVIRCKSCNKELTSHPTKIQCCGCPNMTSVVGEKITAQDLSKVIIVRDNIHKSTQKKVLSNEDLAYQERRRQRKVRRIDFEVR